MRATAPLGAAILCAGFLLAHEMRAYNVAPSLVTLRITAEGTSAFIHLENKGTKPAAIEITIQDHEKDLDGKTIAGRAADDDFIIHPSQLVMIPGDEVSVQLRWLGETQPKAERAYTLTTREVPIPKKPSEESGPEAGIRVEVNVLMNYEVRVYVLPPGAKPKIMVESARERGAIDDTAPAQLEIILANQGTAHASIAASTLVLTSLQSAGPSSRPPVVTLSSKDVPAMKPHLLAGERRRLLIARPPGFPPGPFRATLQSE